METIMWLFILLWNGIFGYIIAKKVDDRIWEWKVYFRKKK